MATMQRRKQRLHKSRGSSRGAAKIQNVEAETLQVKGYDNNKGGSRGYTSQRGSRGATTIQAEAETEAETEAEAIQVKGLQRGGRRQYRERE